MPFIIFIHSVVCHIMSGLVLFLERPKITVRPQDQDLKEGEKAVMNCKATSIPPAKVSWLKDGNPVEEDNDHVITSNGSLVITNLVTKDSGVYQCNRDHDGGWSDFAEATLTVMG